MSKIDENTWVITPDNTNTAEAAHALSNRRGKNLKLMAAILQYAIFRFNCYFFILLILLTYYLLFRGRNLDNERFKAIHIHQHYNIPNRGRDKSSIARN